MIITKNGDISCTDHFCPYAFDGETHYVRGFFYVGGCRSGEESVRQVRDWLRQTGKIPFDRLRGSYVYAIVRENGERLFFAANSEMGCLYISEDAVSSSYLDLLEDRRRRGLPLTFSNEQICEFCTLGKIFFKKTFTREITMLPNDHYVWCRNGSLEVRSKGISAIDGESGIGTPQQFFAELAHALEGHSTASALTGGYDSRLVGAMLCRDVPLHLFFATNSAEDQELPPARKVAELMGRPLEVIRTEKPELNEAFLWERILEGDGMVSMRVEDMTRIQNFHRVLRDEGRDLCLTGDGGVLHKDWEWMQDLPFYHRKKTDLHRFYHQRIAFARSAACLGAALTPEYEKQEDRFVRMMEPFVQGINTESYDFLYHYVSSSQCVGYNCDVPGLSSYAPLWELDLVRYSYHLPRWKRFFYHFIRDLTTEADPEIARVPTVYRTTASSEGRYQFRDVFYQLAQYGEKAYRLLWRTLFHQTPSSGAPLLDWSLQPELKADPTAAAAVSWAVSAGYLSEGTQASALPHAQLGRVIHLYLLARKYEISTESSLSVTNTEEQGAFIV